jgi:hypothetical protein
MNLNLFVEKFGSGDLSKEGALVLAHDMYELYIAATLELNKYRDRMDKVKMEDLCDNVRERELSLINTAALARQEAEGERARADSIKERCATICEDLGCLDCAKAIREYER